jgi:pullulanase
MSIVLFDLLERRREKFVFWIPGSSSISRAPHLILGIVHDYPLVKFEELFRGPFLATDKLDLWELDPNTIQPPLAEGIYQYWFQIQDSSPEGLGIIQVTDPIAYTVDFRVIRGRGDYDQPGSIVKFRSCKLWACDIDGNEPSTVKLQSQESIPENNHLVIYGIYAIFCLIVLKLII